MLFDLLKPDFKSPIFENFLKIDKNTFKSVIQKPNIIEDINISGTTPKVGEFFSYRFKNNSNISMLTDGHFVLLANIIKDDKTNKETLHCYIETLPNIETRIIDAVTNLAILQVYISKKKNLPTGVIVNLHGIIVGLKATANFKPLLKLIADDHFIHEVICSKVNNFVLFDNNNQNSDHFPIKLLELFSYKKFPGKFQITETFDEAIPLVKKALYEYVG